jgi:oligopeptidase B
MWYPLLVRGWVIVFALIRGGGDHTNQYAEAARTYNRERSIHDFQDVIRDVQRRTKISPADTVIYGRSAGGILVGASAHLVGAVYAEVPYVDVLRTSTNPRLPLTKLEYNEFGNPRERLEDFAATLKTSPVDLVPEEGYPNLFALVRTGENDKEVFAYEPIKWIHKLRGRDKKDPTKLLAFGDHEGHFVRGDLAIQHRAVDLAILLGWKRSA